MLHGMSNNRVWGGIKVAQVQLADCRPFLDHHEERLIAAGRVGQSLPLVSRAGKRALVRLNFLSHRCELWGAMGNHLML